MATIEEVIDGETGDEIRVAINNSLNNLNADKLESADYISRNKSFVATTTDGEGDITLSGEQTLNGELTASSRVLVMEQSVAADNGIYVSAAGAWSRSTDADTSAKVLNGMLVFPESGNTRNSKYFLSTANPIILGTTGLTFDSLSSSHNIGGPEHAQDTLANLNTKVSDATILSETEILSITGAISAGIDNKAFCDTSTEGVGNITLSGEQTLNGLLTSASRVLVIEQTLGEDNGFYTTAAGAWSRTADADEDDEVTNGVSTIIDNAGSDVYRHHYLLTTADPITVGTTPLVFAVLPDIEFGTSTGTATEGNDSRVPTQDENDALIGTDGTPATGNKFVTNSDARNTDERVPSGRAIVQARRTTSYTLTGSFADVTLDTADEESDSAVLDHEAGTTDRITIKRTDIYLVTYNVKGMQAGSATVETRIRVNDTTVLPGSEDEEGSGSHNQDHDYTIGRSFVRSFTANDFITLQATQSAGSGSTMDAGAIITISTV